MVSMGLAYSIYLYIIIDQITIWEATANLNSLRIIVIGICITVPLIIAYTIFVYYIFRGKAKHLSYGLDPEG